MISEGTIFRNRIFRISRCDFSIHFCSACCQSLFEQSRIYAWSSMELVSMTSWGSTTPACCRWRSSLVSWSCRSILACILSWRYWSYWFPALLESGATLSYEGSLSLPSRRCGSLLIGRPIFPCHGSFAGLSSFLARRAGFIYGLLEAIRGW